MTAAGLEGQAADPAAIERELGQLWRAEVETLKRLGADETTLARVLLLTLAIYSSSPELAEQAREVAIGINPRQPARAIIMEILASSGSAAPPLEAWVTLHCSRPSGGHQQVCGEQITLEAHPQAARNLPGAVLPLLLTNVPSFLWWQSGSPFGHPVLKELAPAIDRLIVDSYTFASPERELAEIARAVADPRFHAVISDLSWARLGPWRYQTAQIFDAPALRRVLGSLNHATVSYSEGTPALAWLFAGWLASRLGWRPARRAADGAGQVIHFAGGQQVELQPVPLVEASQGGFFVGVKLAAADGGTFEVNRAPANCLVARVAAAGYNFERVRPLPEENHVQWVGHELGKLAPTPIYEAAVSLLAVVFSLP